MGLAETSQEWVEQTCGRLRLTPPCKTLDEVVAAIAGALGRPIDIDLHDMEGSEIYGFCTVRGGRYKVAVTYQATRRQLIRTVSHELVHILQGDVTPDRPSVVYCAAISLRDPSELGVEARAQALVSYLRTGRMNAPGNAVGAVGAVDAGGADHVRAVGTSAASGERGLARFWDELGGFDG